VETRRYESCKNRMILLMPGKEELRRLLSHSNLRSDVTIRQNLQPSHHRRASATVRLPFSHSLRHASGCKAFRSTRRSDKLPHQNADADQPYTAHNAITPPILRYFACHPSYLPSRLRPTSRYKSETDEREHTVVVRVTPCTFHDRASPLASKHPSARRIA
jgi:hypothetical protein